MINRPAAHGNPDSPLAYVFVAMWRLFDAYGDIRLGTALSALIIGSALLLLSAFWTTLRASLVQQLPGSIQSRLPVAA
jgi:hypothetical protein